MTEKQGIVGGRIPANHLINGRNVMLMPTRDEYQFALDLTGMLFTKEELGNGLFIKEELANGLCFINQQSTKPPLDQRKVQVTVHVLQLFKKLHDDPVFQVERIVELVVERYPHADMNNIRRRMNQKCRDAQAQLAKTSAISQQREGEDGHGNQNGEKSPDNSYREDYTQ